MLTSSVYEHHSYFSLLYQVSSCILLFVAVGLDAPTAAPPPIVRFVPLQTKLTCDIWSSNNRHSHHQSRNLSKQHKRRSIEELSSV